MTNTKRKPVRNGRSLTLSHSNVPEKQLMDFGLSEEAAKRAIRVRKIIPYKEDPTDPCIDGKGLWSNIGKPHGQFHVWADRHLKPLLASPETNVQIRTFEDSSKPGKPAKHYKLSRALAVDLAMQFKTPESKEVRAYFVDMESIVFRLAEYNTSRAVVPVKLDNRLTHAAFRQNPKKAITIDIRFKSNLCEALTGLTTEDFRTKYGERVRDFLKRNLAMLDVYNEAYTMAVAMYESGKRWAADIEPLLKQVYGGKIDLEKLLAPQH